MKKYRIANKRSPQNALATLQYDEKKHEFRVFISHKQDITKLPMMLRASASKGEYEMSPRNSMTWVRNRIIPSERQNIGLFLRAYGMKNYHEDLILDYTQGESIQDNYIVIREQ